MKKHWHIVLITALICSLSHIAATSDIGSKTRSVRIKEKFAATDSSASEFAEEKVMLKINI